MPSVIFYWLLCFCLVPELMTESFEPSSEKKPMVCPQNRHNVYLHVYPTLLVSNFNLLTFHRILHTLVLQYGLHPNSWRTETSKNHLYMALLRISAFSLLGKKYCFDVRMHHLHYFFCWSLLFAAELGSWRCFLLLHLKGSWSQGLFSLRKNHTF